MPTYHYRAQTLSGETKAGALDAKDERDLARNLREEGLFLIGIETESKEKPRKNLFSYFTLGRAVSLAEKIFFTRHLAVMLKAGVSITKAMTLLAGQSKNQKFKKAIIASKEEIERGSSLNVVFSKFPDIFSELFINMIKVGEEGGRLEEVLELLADQMQNELDLQNKIKGAMMYPAIIILAMLGIGFFMVVTVVPKLAEVFRDLEIDLPPTTKFVILVGGLMAKYWYLGPLGGVAFFLSLRAFARTSIGKVLIGKLLLAAPFFKDLVRKINSAGLARNLSALIKGGVPIVRAAEVASRTVSNVFFRESLKEVAQTIEKGATLSQAFGKNRGLYPDLLIGMVEVGEETGTLSNTLLSLADFYEKDVSRATANLSSIIEPILMVFIGGVVGFFAISMIQPMYSMLQAI